MNDYRATVIPEGCKPTTINPGTGIIRGAN